jgi:signal transduction histidine kinase/CheY-like chemotaxis protein
VAQSREPIVATHIQHSAEPKAELVKPLGIRAYACNPLLSDGHLLGTLSFASRSRDEFDPDELEFLRTITRYVTVAYERVRLIQRLREADRRKDEFLAMLAHELRNPLSPIRTSVRIVREAAEDDPVLTRNHAIIERQVGQMARLLDDLLDVSRITRGMVHLNPETLDLLQVVRGAIESCRPFIEEKDHRLGASLPEAPLPIEGDRVRLDQVLVNLLSNAVKYTEPGGKIDVELSREGDDAVLCVRDTGKGIEGELLPHIFELFTQGERALDRSQGGLGIGLTLVKSLVELHRGTIEARSEGRGCGSEFIVRLPLAKGLRVTEVAQPTSERPRVRISVSGRRQRVLVVDDNRDGATSLAEVLNLWGFDARALFDGTAAIQAVNEGGVRVVLLDIGMPGMDGYQVSRHIREKHGENAPVLVAMTGYGRERDRQEALAAGFNHHLTKPVDPDQLRQLLEQLVREE